MSDMSQTSNPVEGQAPEAAPEQSEVGFTPVEQQLAELIAKHAEMSDAYLR